jgi:hypothetical protein
MILLQDCIGRLKSIKKAEKPSVEWTFPEIGDTVLVIK